MAEAQKRIFTGFQASGQLHIGNYFGAVKPNVDLFAAQKGLFMVADYHALTSLKDPGSLRTNIIENVKDYLAAGLNLDTRYCLNNPTCPSIPSWHGYLTAL
jgi:tryptophanyl-tRNA synthetase